MNALLYLNIVLSFILIVVFIRMTKARRKRKPLRELWIQLIVDGVILLSVDLEAAEALTLLHSHTDKPIVIDTNTVYGSIELVLERKSAGKEISDVTR